MAQRPVRPPARLQDDVLEAAQPIDVDLALPRHDPVPPVNNPQVDNEQLQAPNLEVLLFILYGIFFSVVCLCGYNSVLCPLGSYRFVQQSNRVAKLFFGVQRMQEFARRGLIELNMAASFVCVFTDRLHLWFSYVTVLSFTLYVHWVCISVIVQGYSAVEFVFAYLV